MATQVDISAPQAQTAPRWRRVLAAIFDFLLAYAVFGWLLMLTVGSRPFQPGGNFSMSLSASGFGFRLEGWPVLLLFALIGTYFIATKRTDLRVFRRLFGIKATP